jgi:hypothetical protein
MAMGGFLALSDRRYRSRREALSPSASRLAPAVT